MSQKRSVWVIIFVVLVAVIAFWRTTARQNQPALPQPTDEVATAVVSPTAAPSQPTTNTTTIGLQQIYYNHEGDFSLLLPTDWVVSEAETTPLGNQYLLGSGTPAGSSILITPATTTLEEALGQVRCDSCQLKEQKEVVLQSSQLPAQRVKLDGDSTRDIEWFFIENDDKLIVLSINNPRTDESLDAIIHSFTPGELTDIGIEALTAVQASRIHLAGQFGLDPYNVVVESIEAEEWGDTCMGADLPSQVCEATPTKGYAMELRLGGQVFPYRANEAGTRAVPLFPIGY